MAFPAGAGFDPGGQRIGTIGAGRDVGTVRVRDAGGAEVAFNIAFGFPFHTFHPDGRWVPAEQLRIA
jgi:hypothetical protein